MVLVEEEHWGEELGLAKQEGPLKPEFRCLAEMEGEAETARTEGGPPESSSASRSWLSLL